MIHFIINPTSRSGRGIHLWEALKSQLDGAQMAYDCYFTKSYEETVSYVAGITAFDQDDADLALPGRKFLHHIAVLGGDGTVNEVLNGVVDREHTCISYLPTGSGNDLARSIGLRSSAKEAFSHLTGELKPLTVDVGRVSGVDENGVSVSRMFAISSGIGFDAAACAKSTGNGAKKLLNRIGLGKLTYLANAFVCLFQTPDSSCTITLDDKTKLTRASLFFCVSMIQKFEGGGFPFCPAADSQDGMFDVCVVSDIKKRHVSYVLPLALFGKHTITRFVQILRAKKIEIETSIPLWVHTDGEVPGKFSRIVIEQPEQGHITFLL